MFSIVKLSRHFHDRKGKVYHTYVLINLPWLFRVLSTEKNILIKSTPTRKIINYNVTCKLVRMQSETEPAQTYQRKKKSWPCFVLQNFWGSSPLISHRQTLKYKIVGIFQQLQNKILFKVRRFPCVSEQMETILLTITS